MKSGLGLKPPPLWIKSIHFFFVLFYFPKVILLIGAPFNINIFIPSK